jgi:hypothetical protein
MRARKDECPQQSTWRSGSRDVLVELLGRCGDSGSSTEPHAHLQAIDRPDVRYAAVPITFGGRLPRNGEIVEVGPADGSGRR